MSRETRRPNWLLAGILIAALAVAALKANWRMEQIVDIDGTDETQYLAIGLEMPTKGPPDARKEIFFAPLYSLWYLGLAQIEPDPIRLPGLNFRILSVLLAWALYGLLRRAGCPAIPAALTALLLIAHHLSLEPATRSIHFAVICLAGGMGAALGASTRVRQCCALGLGAALAAYTRPEYAMLALLMLLGAGLLYCIRRFRQNPDDWKFLVGTFALVSGLLLWFGPPVGAGNDRSFLAFAQHFSSNYLHRHPSDVDPWWESRLVMAQVFEGSETLVQAWRKNPSEFWRHISENLHDFLVKIGPISTSHRNFLLPEGSRWQIVESGLLVGIFGLLVVACRKRIGPNLRWFGRQIPLLLFMLAAAGLVVAGMILTSVDERYFFPLVFLGLFFAVTVLARSDTAGETLPFAAQPLWLGGFALLLVGLAPASPYREQNITSTRSALTQLAQHSFREGTGFVEAMGTKRMEIFLPSQLHFVHPTEKTEPFGSFLESHQVGAIHLTPYLRGARAFARDPEWQEFLERPAQFGFSKIALPFQETLYVRDSVLTRPLGLR